ncbi:hypothetical protein [Sphingobacterium siyangense]|uniref:hypothetical protein n=1 Tax=Sphingobacterium siyangense TaxID=459529 RepID=UPI002899D724|nr:hypothetical protein [Sphingobacterium siyangense]
MSTRSSEEGDANDIAISRLGFSIKYWHHFFGQGAKFYNGHVQLPLTTRFDHIEFQPEILYLDGRRRIPSRTYYEHNISNVVNSDQRIYLFQSSLDALAYFQLRSMMGTNAIIFVLGKNPDETVIEYLKKKFHYAKFILCFPKGLMNTISEIRTTGLLVGEPLTLEIEDNNLLCGYRGRKKQIPLPILTLSRLSRTTGFYPKSIKTQKPPKGYQSFFDLLRSQKLI